jgi:hypothetical protein
MFQRYADEIQGGFMALLVIISFFLRVALSELEVRFISVVGLKSVCK